jgi:hypothetical protein
MNTRVTLWLGLALGLAVGIPLRAAPPAAGDDRTAIRALVHSLGEVCKKGDNKAFEALLSKKARDSGSVDSSAIQPDPDMTCQTRRDRVNPCGRN